MNVIAEGIHAFTGGDANLAPSTKTMGWERYVGTKGVAFGISHPGASAPADEELGLTAQRIADEAANLLR